MLQYGGTSYVTYYSTLLYNGFISVGFYLSHWDKDKQDFVTISILTMLWRQVLVWKFDCQFHYQKESISTSHNRIRTRGWRSDICLEKNGSFKLFKSWNSGTACRILDSFSWIFWAFRPGQS